MAKLVPAKCPSCGATIVVDPDKDAAICEYCDNAFIVSKAIINYGNTVNIVNNKITSTSNYIHPGDNQWTYQAQVTQSNNEVKIQKSKGLFWKMLLAIPLSIVGLFALLILAAIIEMIF